MQEIRITGMAQSSRVTLAILCPPFCYSAENNKPVVCVSRSVPEVSAFVFMQVEKCADSAAAVRSVKNETQPEERPAATVNSVCLRDMHMHRERERLRKNYGLMVTQKWCLLQNNKI